MLVAVVLSIQGRGVLEEGGASHRLGSRSRVATCSSFVWVKEVKEALEIGEDEVDTMVGVTVGPESMQEEEEEVPLVCYSMGSWFL